MPLMISDSFQRLFQLTFGTGAGGEEHNHGYELIDHTHIWGPTFRR